ncbi:MAG: AAA family ATPase [Acidimicrobiales bacterium]
MWRDGERLRLTRTNAEAIAALVAAGPDGLTLDQAAERFWGERQPSTPEASVRMRMSRLRKLLGDDAVPANDNTYRLALAPEQVDAWVLRSAAGDGPLPATNTELLRLLEGDPYTNQEDVVGDAELRRVGADRSALIERVRRDAPDLIDDRVEVAADHLAAASSAATPTTAGPSGAPRTASATPSDEVPAPRPPARSTPADLTRPPSAARPDGPLGDAAAVRDASPTLAAQLRHAIVGRDATLDDLLADLDRTSAAMALGPSGSGKTRLVAEIVARRRADRVVYVCGHQLTSVAYGPFLAAVPDFAVRLGAASDDDLLVHHATVWQSFVDAIAPTGSGRTLVIVDDAQWLDSASAGLVEFLVSSAPGGKHEIVVAGRTEDDSDDWRAARTALQAAAPTTDLSPLTSADLERLIGVIHPSSHTQARQLFAAELEGLTRGLPAVARLVIEHADPVTLQHTPVRDERPIGHHLDDLPAAAIEIGAAAAVIGDAVDVADLAELTGHPESLVVEMLDVLHRARLVRESRPERVEFEHVLIGDAFAAAVSPSRRRRLHRAAAERTTDLGSRAAHLLEALPLVDETEAFEALVAAAHAHGNERLHREAARKFAQADELRPGSLAISDRVAWATSAERGGLDARPLREAAFAAATRAGDASAALAAAMSGLPEAEPQGGDPDRLALLTRVDAGALSRAERFELAAERGRQYELLGRTMSAHKALIDATGLAASPEDHARLTSLRRLLDFESLGPLDRLVPVPSPRDALAPRTRARIHLLRTFDLLSLGDLPAARDEADTAAELLERDPSPLLQWWLLLTRSTFAWLAGHVADAQAACEAARRHGQRYGLRNAAAAWLGQQLFMARAFGPVPHLASVLETLPPDIISSPVARAGAAIVRYESTEGPAERAVALDELRYQATLASETPWHTAAVLIGLLSEFLVDADDQLRQEARGVLLPQRGSWILFGTGVFLQGPADLALADLSRGAEREALLFDALAMADKLESPLWQAIVRLELARRGLGDDFVGEAHEIAAGREFEPLLPAPGSGADG